MGEFTVKIDFISLETNGEDFFIVWSGKSSNLKDAFNEIESDVNVSGKISKSTANCFGNFGILPYERNDDFYINSKLKSNLIAIESYNKDLLSVDSIVTEDKFIFLTTIINSFDLTVPGNWIWLKARLNLADDSKSNHIEISPSRTVFFDNGDFFGMNKYWGLSSSVDLFFFKSKPNLQTTT